MGTEDRNFVSGIEPGGTESEAPSSPNASKKMWGEVESGPGKGLGIM